MAQTSASPGLTPTVYPNRLLKYANKKAKKRKGPNGNWGLSKASN